MMDICADNGRIFPRVHKRPPPNKPDACARICQREQSLKDNLIVFFAGRSAFDVSGTVASEQTVILLISLVFSNLACL